MKATTETGSTSERERNRSYDQAVRWESDDRAWRVERHLRGEERDPA